MFFFDKKKRRNVLLKINIYKSIKARNGTKQSKHSKKVLRREHQMFQNI